MLLLSDVCIQATLTSRKGNTDDALYSEDALGFWLSPYRIARRLVEAVVPAARPKLPLSTILQPLVPLSNASNLRYSVYADVTGRTGNPGSSNQVRCAWFLGALARAAPLS